MLSTVSSQLKEKEQQNLRKGLEIKINRKKKKKNTSKLFTWLLHILSYSSTRSKMVVDVYFRKECRKSEYMLIVARIHIRRDSHIRHNVVKKSNTTKKILMTRHLVINKAKQRQKWYELFISHKVRRIYQLRQ